MSWKDEFIERYGEEAYTKRSELGREWCKNNPEKIREKSRQTSRKGGKYYERKQEYYRTGLQGERGKVRHKHGARWRPYKRIIAPDSICHHQWCQNSAEYDGVALVEKDQHQHGFIDIIQILKGRITLLTEKEVRMGNRWE